MTIKKIFLYLKIRKIRQKKARTCVFNAFVVEYYISTDDREKFEDTKVVIRSRNSKDRHYNVKKKKNKKLEKFVD
jgi:hypothetical protein